MNKETKDEESLDVIIPLWAKTCRIQFSSDDSLRKFNETKTMVCLFILGFCFGAITILLLHDYIK